MTSRGVATQADVEWCVRRNRLSELMNMGQRGRVGKWQSLDADADADRGGSEDQDLTAWKVTVVR